jgi:hypothetical protein
MSESIPKTPTPHNSVLTRISQVSLNQDKKCVICLEYAGSERILSLAKFACGHFFCQDCIFTLADKQLKERKTSITCPMCRFYVKIESVEQIKSGNNKQIQLYKDHSELINGLSAVCAKNDCIATGTIAQLNNSTVFCPERPVFNPITSRKRESKSKLFEEIFPKLNHDFNKWFSIENGFDDVVKFIITRTYKLNGEYVAYGEIFCSVGILHKSENDTIYVQYIAVTINEYDIYRNNPNLSKKQIQEVAFNMAKLAKLNFYLHFVNGCCNRYTEVHIDILDYLKNELVLIINEEPLSLKLDEYVDITKDKFDFFKLRQHLGSENFAKLMSNEQVAPTAVDTSTVLDQFGNKTEMFLIERPTHGKYYKPLYKAEGEATSTEVERLKTEIDAIKDRSQNLLIDPDNMERFAQENLDPQTVAELDRLQYISF